MKLRIHGGLIICDVLSKQLQRTAELSTSYAYITTSANTEELPGGVEVHAQVVELHVLLPTLPLLFGMTGFVATLRFML